MLRSYLHMAVVPWLTLVLSMLPLQPVCAQGATAEKLAAEQLTRGKVAAQEERCAECHGLDGNVHLPNEAGKIPKLAGQRQEYLLKQFQDFRHGDRENDLMGIMARNLDDADVEPILAWYASQEVKPGALLNNSDSMGRLLFTEGDQQRGIVACALCHGLDARGVSAAIQGFPNLDPALVPALAGQDWHYLDQQLRDWRDGTRTNSPDGVMNKVTRQLTDAEINALNDFLSGLQ